MLVLVAAAALSIGLFASRGAGSGPGSNNQVQGSEESASEILLRLHDLPLGYRISGGSPLFPAGLKCNSLRPADPQPALELFLKRNAPAGCLGLYSRIYRVAGSGPAPKFVGTAAIRLTSTAAAEEGLSVAPLLISHATADELPEEAPPPATVGDAARLFHWRHAGIFSGEEESTSWFVWRSQSTVALTFVAGGRPRADDRIATELAAIQQRRVAAPTPYLPAEYDDRAVPLEDPGLSVPVYWLGERFTPGHDLPPLRFQDSYSSRWRKGIPRAATVYAAHPLRPRHEEVFVDIWSQRQWRRLRAGGYPLPGSLFCGATARRFKLHRGTAVIFHGKEKLLGRCGKVETPSWTVRARIGHVIVTAETVEVCEVCAGPGSGAYNSLAGMKAIALGLERRLHTAG